MNDDYLASHKRTTEKILRAPGRSPHKKVQYSERSCPSLKNADVYLSSLHTVDLPLTHLKNFLVYILTANFFHKIASAGDIFSFHQGTI